MTILDASPDISRLRAQFPALAQQNEEGLPYVFFDGPGGTHVPASVIEAVSHYYRTINANTHGVFFSSARTAEMLVRAHEAAADLLGCAPNEVAFGQNMTTLTFAMSRSIGQTLSPGDEILLTHLDHDANFTPWVLMAKDRGLTVRIANVDLRDCTLDMRDLESKLNARTKLVAVGLASNACGSRNDIAHITKLAHQVGAWVYADAVHYAPHGPIDVRELDCDFLACSVYKFFGPHLGMLYGKSEILERLPAYKVRPAENMSPHKWETGTQNHEGIAGTIAAIEYLADLGRTLNPSARTRREALVAAMTWIKQYERELSTYLVRGLQSIEGLTIYGITDPAQFDWRTPTFAIRMAKHSPETLAEALARRGICCWSGNFYAQNLSEQLGVEETGGFLRIGLVHYNTTSEIDRLIKALQAL